MGWRPLPGEGDAEPRRLAESLDEVTRCLGAPMVALVTRWPEVAGAAAPHCRPVGLAGGTLTVAVDQPARATDVRYRGADLLRRVGEVVGPGVVERLEVRVRPLR